jgi:hypothetical protein
MDVWDCALGFMDAQILLTAEELQLFRSLEAKPRTAAEVGVEIGLHPDAAQRLLTALSALGFVKHLPDGCYANSREASEQLVPGKPGYVGGMFPHLREDLYPVWRYCKEALLEQNAQWHRAFSTGPSPTEHMFVDERRLRDFLNGMHVITYQAGSEFAVQAPELHQVKSIVDVGGASGAFLIALAEAHPHLRGTVFDLPVVRRIAEDYLHRHYLSERLCFHPGDFWKDDLPQGADAYALGFILHDWDTAGGSVLLKKIADVAPPGGLLIVAEYLLDENKTGPWHVTRMDLNMLVAARGQERTAREYAEWISEFGFELQRIQPTSRGKNFLIARRH